MWTPHRFRQTDIVLRPTRLQSPSSCSLNRELEGNGSVFWSNTTQLVCLSFHPYAFATGNSVWTRRKKGSRQEFWHWWSLPHIKERKRQSLTGSSHFEGMVIFLSHVVYLKHYTFTVITTKLMGSSDSGHPLYFVPTMLSCKTLAVVRNLKSMKKGQNNDIT